MRTEHLDNKINELEALRSRGELTYMGGEMLSEFNEIKRALTIPVVSQQRELLDRLNKIENWCYNKATDEDLEFLNKIFRSENCAEVPAVRVRNYNEETGDTELGTLIDATLNTYLVIPDYNLSMTVRWDKMNCDVLR
tara:strand:+ start:525 stop:938 length:414 start_codon:yes stop_codon:yes gene_type:complete